jgi:signal transduction histidine kinase
MTAIRGYLWLALNKSGDKIDPTIKHHLEVSYDSTIRLINLVNDMLTISRLERKTIEIKKEPIDIIPIVRAVYDELKIQADEKHVAFEIIHDDKPYEIDGDKDKLRDVFQNLVGNALKFTLEGHVKITCSRTDTQIKVAVEDTGPGIRKEDRDKLFGKFAKLDHAYKNISNVQGTGLGLYITKKIVSLHGGDITVQSEVDQGTTFTVTLPAR